MAPVILLFLAIIGNHSDIASVPPATAFFTTTGWVAGVFVFIFVLKDKANPDVTIEERGDQHTGVSGTESFTSR